MKNARMYENFTSKLCAFVSIPTKEEKSKTRRRMKIKWREAKRNPKLHKRLKVKKYKRSRKTQNLLHWMDQIGNHPPLQGTNTKFKTIEE